MSIRVNIHPSLQYLTNDLAVVEVNGNAVGQCLDDLVEQFPSLQRQLFDDKGELLNYVEIYVNMESTFPLELTRQVKDGDEVSIILMIAGG